jgi:hypothetical protein
MTCKPEINKRYATRDEAWGYLASRGFACGALSGWENGRWAATVTREGTGFKVTVWLRAELPISQAA